MELFPSIQRFIAQIASGGIEIYNEFSLQHELGIHLRGEFSSLNIQFERNVTYFGLNKSNYTKREIDLAVFKEPAAPLAAIELKFPRNGQYPEQMFSFCKDIAFLEELRLGGFRACAFLAIADDPAFYRGNNTGIYGFFRGGCALNGIISKPTGKKDSQILIRGSYDINWHQVHGKTKYTWVEVAP